MGKPIYSFMKGSMILILSDIDGNQNKKAQISPLRAIAIAVLIFAIIKIFAVDTLRVEGRSMEPTLLPGRIIFVNRLAYGFLLPFSDKYLVTWGEPARNSLVVLRSPMNGERIVKRCIAIPGDKIKIKEGRLFIDSIGSFEVDSGTAPFFMTEKETIVPDKKFLVLGDNLKDSVDSRSFGFAPLDRVTGCVLF